MGLVKIKFDSNQDYQIKAVDAVLNALEGIDKDIVQTGFQELSFNQSEADDIVSNADELFEFREDILLDNINKVRKENNLESKAQLGLDDFNDGDTLPFMQNQSMLVRYRRMGRREKSGHNAKGRLFQNHQDEKCSISLRGIESEIQKLDFAQRN